MMDEPKREIFEFPAELSLRVIGPEGEDFEGRVLAAVSKHVAGLDESALSKHSSKGGKYSSIIVKFTAGDRAQLEAVYAELKNLPGVVMVI